MKKITLKISAFLLFAMCTLQVQGQACPEVWLENGTYKIAVCTANPGDPATELYMTINGSTGALEWAALLPGDDPTQVWTITDHRTPASTGLMEIWATIPGVGNFTMATGDISGHPNLTLIARAGDPVSVTPLTGDYTGLDQFQRRRTAGFGGPGNDALFLRNPSGTNSRYGVVPSAAGDPVQFDGGGIDGLRFIFVAALSTKEFDANSVFITNPVKDELTIESVDQNIKQVSIYSLIGQRVMLNNVKGDSSSIKLDVSSLNSGIYILKLEGENNTIFSKKIIKE